jgi:hypothetical protein
MSLSSLPDYWKVDRDLLVVMGKEAELQAAAWKKLGQTRVLAIVPEETDAESVPDIPLARNLDDVRSFVWSMKMPVKHISMRLTTLGGIEQETAQQFAQHLQEEAQRHRTLMWSLDKLGPIWASNSIHNSPWLATKPWLADYRDTFKGVPMIVIGAGPSLGKDIETLKQAKGKAIIVAVHRTLESLHRAGVQPDISIAVECRDVKHQFENVNSEKLAAVALASMVENNLQDVGVERTIQFASNAWEGWLLPEEEREANVALSLGTVSHSAVSMGKVWGCDPIILVGQDLSFPEGQVYHDRGADGDTHIELDEGSGQFRLKGFSEWRNHTLGEDVHELFGCVEVEAIGGGKVLTSTTFHDYRVVLEDWAEQWTGQLGLINASSCGAFISGWTHADLGETLSALPDIGLDVHERFRETEESAPGRNREAHIIDCVRQTQSQLRRVNQLAGQCLKLIQRTMTKPADNNLRKLAALEAQLKDASRNLPLLTLATQYQIKLTVNQSPSIKDLRGSLRLSAELYTQLRGQSHTLLQACDTALETYSAQG